MPVRLGLLKVFAKGKSSQQPQLKMNPNKALWEKGDFTRIAETMRESGHALVQRLGITKGMKVLDLGCGDGTTALPAAKLAADVMGVEIARNGVDAGNKRASDSERSNVGGADFKNQLKLHAAAGRFRQPDDLGHRRQCDRAVCRGRCFGRADLIRAGHVYFQLSRHAFGVCG